MVQYTVITYGSHMIIGSVCTGHCVVQCLLKFKCWVLLYIKLRGVGFKGRQSPLFRDAIRFGQIKIRGAKHPPLHSEVMIWLVRFVGYFQ